MVLALLVCSDDACAHDVETPATLEELETLACECGCFLEVIAISEVELVEPAFPDWEYALPLAA
jgi:hypothetical protein